MINLFLNIQLLDDLTKLTSLMAKPDQKFHLFQSFIQNAALFSYAWMIKKPLQIDVDELIEEVTMVMIHVIGGYKTCTSSRM